MKNTNKSPPKSIDQSHTLMIHLKEMSKPNGLKTCQNTINIEYVQDSGDNFETIGGRT